MLPQTFDDDIAMEADNDVVVNMLVPFGEYRFFIMRYVQHRGQSVIPEEF